MEYKTRIENRLAGLRSDNSARQACADIAAEADARIERLRHALAFYADPKRYHGPNQRAEEGDPYTEAGPYMLDVTRDAGMLARAVLVSG